MDHGVRNAQVRRLLIGFQGAVKTYSTETQPLAHSQGPLYSDPLLTPGLVPRLAFVISSCRSDSGSAWAPPTAKNLGPPAACGSGHRVRCNFRSRGKSRTQEVSGCPAHC